jgi:MFS family permease
MKIPWLKQTLPIAAIFSFRMLGLFMLIPVFTVYATHLAHATPTRIGIALGIYGLSQGILQIPFGLLSDRYGRKRLITIGLVFFALGSLLGANVHSIEGMIVARALQGMGAIGSVLIALLADVTDSEHRTKAMAVIGFTIGASFSLAMIASPLITHAYGLSGLFYLSTGLAVLGLILLHRLIKTPPHVPIQNTTKWSQFKLVLSEKPLLRLNAGIFCQHLILTATFFVIPILFAKQQSLGHITAQWHIYLPLMLGAFLVMMLFLGFFERKGLIKWGFLSSILITGLSQIAFITVSASWIGLCGCLFAYFVAFNILEAELPSMISKQAPPQSKGTAMGIYSSCQFLGIFAGGTLAGITAHYSSYTGIFVMNAIISACWLIIARGMGEPTHHAKTPNAQKSR